MKKKSLKIAIFHLGFFYSGGGEKLVIEEARGLKKLGHQVIVFAPVVDRRNCLPDLISKIDIRPLFFQLPSWLPFKDGLMIIFSCLTFPFQFFRFSCFDLFFGANQPGVYFAWVSAFFFKKPYFAYLAQPNRLLYRRKIDLEQKIRIKERDYLVLTIISKLFGPLIAWLDRQSIEGAKTVFANGKYAALQLEQVYQTRPVICPAGCYPFSFGRLNYQKRRQGNLQVNGFKIQKPFILLTNRHYPQKKFEYAIRAIFNFQFSIFNVRLVITGKETKYTDKLKQEVKDKKLEDRVVFTGFVSEKELKKLYQNAVVYVYSSPEEDFGMGVIEAMAAGIPLVAWNYGGPKYIVKNKQTGFLAKPYEVKDLSLKIKKLLSDDKLAEKIGRQANKVATEGYSYKAHCQLLEEHFLL